MTQPSPADARVPTDNPIRTRNDDTLGRTAVAYNFVDHVLALDASEGLVVGVLGPWGSGKTSFINLALARFAEHDVTKLDFNPWMFSGSEQLVEHFFVELSAQLKLDPRYSGLAGRLSDYGETFAAVSWLPLVGPWLERFRSGAKALNDFLEKRRRGLAGRRDALVKALRALDKPIVVTLDDIDRLSTVEIQHIFKLVRLTASFPNIVYVLAFDRGRVESALAETGLPGRHYLEKILQVAVDLPELPTEVLDRQVFSFLDRSLAGLDIGLPLDTAAWTDLFVEVVRPLIRNMRDVRRYAASVRGTVLDLRGGAALADVLALEAVRVFLPDVFSRIHGSVEGLTTIGEPGARHEKPTLKAQVESIVAIAEDKQVANALINRLFPAAQRHIGNMHYTAGFADRWLRARRVAHPDILRLYLERTVGTTLQAFREAERHFSIIDTAEKFDRELRKLPADHWQDVVGALEVFEDVYKPEHVRSGVTVLLNLMSDVPVRKGGMFELSTHMVFTRVIYRLLKCLNSPEQTEAAVPDILAGVRGLSARLELIEIIGHRENRGHKLVTVEFATHLETEWSRQARSLSEQELQRESDPLGLLLAYRRFNQEDPFPLPASPMLTLALLRGAKSDIVSQPFDSRAARRIPRLQWKALITAVGSEDRLGELIGELEASGLANDTDELALALKYRAGWRPDRDIPD